MTGKEWGMNDLLNGESYDRRRSELWAALTFRPLTDEELREVGAYGSTLNRIYGTPFMASEKLQELTNALLVQQMLRGSK